jgi:hypothetical protein
MILISPFGMVRLVSVSFCFAALHTSLNQGARVFAHLFGLQGCFNLITFTTPASIAYCRMKSSTAAARASLLNVPLDTISWSPYVNPC